MGHGDGTGFRRECISCRLDYERQNILLAMNVKMSVHRYNGHASEMNRTRSSLLGEGVAEQGLMLHSLIMALWQNALHYKVAVLGEDRRRRGGAGLFSCRKLFTGKCDGLAGAHQ